MSNPASPQDPTQRALAALAERGAILLPDDPSPRAPRPPRLKAAGKTSASDMVLEDRR